MSLMVTLVRLARERLPIPVIASLNGTTSGDWVRYAGTSPTPACTPSN